MTVTTSRVRVRYAETDAMGVVHHAAYIVWLEVGRVDWLKAQGMDYREIEASGISLAVSGLEVRYASSAVFDDEISVETRMTEAKSRRVRFEYSLRHAEYERLIIKASTVHVPTTKAGIAVRLPAEWLGRLERLVAAV